MHLSLPRFLRRRKKTTLDNLTEDLIERRGRSDYFALRKRWSNWLLACLVILVVFQILLTASIGLGCLNYKEYKGFLYTIVAENFLQMIGLCYVVVEFLFPQNEIDSSSSQEVIKPEISVASEMQKEVVQE